MNTSTDSTAEHGHGITRGRDACAGTRSERDAALPEPEAAATNSTTSPQSNITNTSGHTATAKDKFSVGSIVMIVCSIFTAVIAGLTYFSKYELTKGAIITIACAFVIAILAVLAYMYHTNRFKRCQERWRRHKERKGKKSVPHAPPVQNSSPGEVQQLLDENEIPSSRSRSIAPTDATRGASSTQLTDEPNPAGVRVDQSGTSGAGDVGGGATVERDGSEGALNAETSEHPASGITGGTDTGSGAGASSGGRGESDAESLEAGINSSTCPLLNTNTSGHTVPGSSAAVPGLDQIDTGGTGLNMASRKHSVILSNDCEIYELSGCIPAVDVYSKLGRALLGSASDVANIIGKTQIDYEEVVYKCLYNWRNANGSRASDALLSILSDPELRSAKSYLENELKTKPLCLGQDKFLQDLMHQIDCARDYKKLCLKLVKNAAALDNIMGHPTPQYHDAFYKVLIKWRDREGFSLAALEKLRKILMENGQMEAVDWIDKKEYGKTRDIHVDHTDETVAATKTRPSHNPVQETKLNKEVLVGVPSSSNVPPTDATKGASSTQPTDELDTAGVGGDRAGVGPIRAIHASGERHGSQELEAGINFSSRPQYNAVRLPESRPAMIQSAEITAFNSRAGGDSVVQNPYPSDGRPRSVHTKEQFYDIYLVYTKEIDHVKKVKDIIHRNELTMTTPSDRKLGLYEIESIENALENSSHVVLIITEQDCKAKDNQRTHTIEMAFQSSRLDASVFGRVLPIRCCDKSYLPLKLRCLMSASINDSDLEARLVDSIDTDLRLQRMKELSLPHIAARDNTGDAAETRTSQNQPTDEPYTAPRNNTRNATEARPLQNPVSEPGPPTDEPDSAPRNNTRDATEARPSQNPVSEPGQPTDEPDSGVSASDRRSFLPSGKNLPVQFNGPVGTVNVGDSVHHHYY